MIFMEAMAWQAIQSINILEDGFDDEGCPINCCPICCGPCHALNAMISDPHLLVRLEAAIESTSYVVDGWSYWSKKRQGLKIMKIKEMWYWPNGTHKQICVSSNGVDQSAQLHRAILEAKGGK